ncbi:MAG: CDP-alcohol phosphatidyltransferase family protein [Planctomycetota bacterium]|jgi:CDP-diacylglycerol--glycerol-3-phosphate 3-phosphatidyltransferase|nr:CDP-alcohol phosphatidyltransferase family protein [Planctomycetota bacterium]
MHKRLPLFNLPNALTLSRFFLAPAMLWLVLALRDPEIDAGAWKASLAALLVLILTLLTDLFDGTLARARREVTTFGKIMDPVADSTFFMTLLFGLSASRRFGASISVWLPVLVLYREIAIHILRRYAALKGNAIPARMSGKIKMFTQSLVTAAFFLLVAVRDWTFAGGGTAIGESFLRGCARFAGVFAVIVNLLSLVEYSRDVPELIAEYAQTDSPGADGKP